MSSRKPGGAGGGAAAAPATATLDDNASVENPASSEESSTGVGEELATVSVKPSASPTPTHVEAGEPAVAGAATATAEVEVDRDQDAKEAKDAKESSPAPKIPTPTITTATTRRTPTPTLTPTSDSVAIKSVRITRHSSPLLLLSSPTTSRREVSGSDAAAAGLDGEESSTQGSQPKSSVERSLAPVIRGRKSIKDLKEAKEVKSEEATVGVATYELALKEEPLADSSETHESQLATDEKDHKDIKDKDKEKEIKEEKEKEKNKEPVTTPTTCNRVTRKSHAQEQANNTRITRNRRQSSTVASITSAASLPIAAAATSSGASEQPPPLPPGRGRRKKPVAVVVAASKRKRSEDADPVADPEASSAAKYSKVVVVVKTEDGDANEEDTSTVLAGAIKQEPMDSSEVRSTPSPAVTPTPTPAPAPTGRRGRGRPQNRNSTSPATSAATTRATRLSKAGSPGIVAQEPAPPKRRRVGSSTRKTASASSLAPSSQGGAGDEDSKDSMASSMDDLLLAAADIKQEKLTPDFDESLLTESLPSTSAASIASISSANGHSSSCIEPLTVDTESSSTTTNKPADPTAVAKLKESPTAVSSVESPSPSKPATQGPASEAGKAPSLSPEMISEGVSAVSVRKFYKKPEFLENNLGIEKDPELGEIVQTVSSGSNATEAEADVETAVGEVDVAETPTESSKPKTEVKLTKLEVEPASKEEIVQLQVEQKEEKTESEPEAEAAVPEIPADVVSEVTVEITHEGEIEGELEVSSYSNSSLKAGQLRLDDTNDGGDEVLLEDEEEEGRLIINGDEIPPAESEEKLVHLEDQDNQEPQQKPGDYDDFEHEIMEELAKEGVLDASGNALSQQTTSADVPLAESKRDAEEGGESSKDPSPVDEMVAMEVDESYIDMKQQAEQLLAEHLAGADATEADDCCIEENKENLSTTPAAASGGAAEGLVVVDIPLTLKDEDNEEEKPLAVMAAEQKQELPPFKLALQLDLEEKANGKKEESLDDGDELQQQQRREQEIHLHNLGLLTHQAAEQRRQDLQEAHTRQAQLQQKQQHHYHQHSHQQLHHHQQHKRQGARGGGGGGGGGGSATHVESSGTLKTVIKLNRSSNGGMGGSGGLPTGTVIHGSSGGGGGSSSASSTSSSSVGSATRKSSGALGSGTGAGAVAGVRRQSLKMTFQKGRARGHGAADRSADQHGAHAEDSYYTIQNENEGATKSSVTTGNPGRKTNNRFSSTNNHHSTVANSHGSHSAVQYNSSHSEGQGQAEHGFYQMVKKDEKEKILIPEKASSFKFHPGRLCEDQCYYCSGKFGLYDTPCHVGQIKSVERQQKILANEEKLTVDNCLCDACFRHVDRRANAPSYKKRLSAPGHLETGVGNSAAAAAMEKHFAGDRGVIPEAAGEAGNATGTGGASGPNRACAVKDCVEGAGHSLRRKCIRKSVKKFQLNLEIPAGTSNVWLCEAHYNTVIQFSGCVLCKRRLGKNHMYNITTDTDRLEKALAEMGIPVQLGMGTAVCKLCRYFANLLMKPPDSTKSQKAEFVKNYRKRLLKVHNLQDGSHEVSEADEEEAPSAAEERAAVGGDGDGQEDAEMPMVVDDDGPTDSNSSSSSTTQMDTSKQMSKLQAILQQNLGAADGASTGTAPAAASAAAGGGGAGGSGTGADISNVLRGNPNISMRELFHGEEELGVQFKVPFGCSSSQRTPEGWTRVQTFLQYDEPTRRLWEELQKPYGNQSSFLRHLILLEKYYRNGDLVLAAHASSNATVYTETVRQRLNSFDHGHCGGLGSTPSCGSGSSSGSGSSKRSGIPQPATGSVLATALTTPTAASLASSSSAVSSAEQPSTTDPVIPLVELNDDDDDGEDGAAAAGLDDSESDLRQAESPLERLSTVSVDKLTKQLSSNAVTIIARPKDKSLLASNNATASASASTSASASSSSSSSATSSPEEVVITKNAVTTAAAAASSAPIQPKDAPPLVPTIGGNSRSILKTNLLGINKAAVEIVPLTSSAPHTATASIASITSIASLANKQAAEKQHKILDAANKLFASQGDAQSSALLSLQSKLKGPMQQQGSGAGSVGSGSQKPSSVAQLLSSPPELISLQRRRTSAAAAPATISNSLLGNLHGKRLQLPRVPAGATGGAGAGAGTVGNRGGGAAGAAPPNVVILPDTLTPQERHESKSWKPTLIPLEDQVPNKSHALYQTADGRRLPALVQVQSGGKPYLISIFDYNRMCILRREKLLRDQMLKTNSKQKPQNQQQGQTQQQQQQQGSAASAAAFSNMVKLAQQQTARQQLQQLQQKQQQQHLPTLQPGGVGAGGGAGGAAGAAVRLARLAPKPMPPLTNPQIGSQAPNFQPLLPNPLDNSNSSWLWKNFPDPNQYLLNGNGGGAAGNSASKLPHLTAKPATATSSGSAGVGGGGGNNVHKAGGLYAIKLHQLQQQQHQQKLIDNAIMSKIPKSLTVIPQQMGGGAGSSSSSSLGDLGGGGGSSSGKD